MPEPGGDLGNIADQGLGTKVSCLSSRGPGTPRQPHYAGGAQAVGDLLPAAAAASGDRNTACRPDRALGLSL